MESLVLTFEETCAALNSNRSFVNGAVKRGDLESFVIGKRLDGVNYLGRSASIILAGRGVVVHGQLSALSPGLERFAQ